MSSKLYRVVFLSVVVFLLAAAVPAFAGQEPAPSPKLQAAAGCPPAAELFASQNQAQVCKANDAVAVPEQPEFMTASISTNKYHGYCQCGCRFVKDCNTDADCHGGRCLSGVSCC
jgi:hypothetical protein